MHKGKHSSREGVPLPVLQQEEDLRRKQPLPLVVFFAARTILSLINNSQVQTITLAGSHMSPARGKGPGRSLLLMRVAGGGAEAAWINI